MANAPWPGDGRNSSFDKRECFVSTPSLEIPAFARTIPSIFFSVTLLILVSIFPRIGLTFRSGRFLEIWTARLKLLLPTVEP